MVTRARADARKLKQSGGIGNCEISGTADSPTLLLPFGYVSVTYIGHLSPKVTEGLSTKRLGRLYGFDIVSAVTAVSFPPGKIRRKHSS